MENTTVSNYKYYFKDNRMNNLYMFVGATLFSVAISMCSSFSFFWLAVNSSKNLHHKMLQALLKTTMYFFDSTPLGKHIRVCLPCLPIFPFSIIDCIVSIVISWKTIDQLITSETNVMVYKSLHELVLQYMCNLFTRASQLTSRCLRSTLTDLRLPKKSSKLVKNVSLSEVLRLGMTSLLRESWHHPWLALKHLYSM